MRRLKVFFGVIGKFSEHQSALCVSRELEAAYSTVWNHMHKVRDFAAAKMLEARAISLSLEDVEPALLKLSAPVPFSSVSMMKLNSEEPGPPSMDLIDLSDDERKQICWSIIAFLLSIFHGVSRKHAHRYVVEFSLKRLGFKLSLGEWLHAFIRAGPGLRFRLASGWKSLYVQTELMALFAA